MKKSPTILIDFEKIKDPYCGLGQYCAHLKTFFDRSTLNIHYWIPNRFEKLAKKISYLLPKSDIFHAIHQDSPYLPWSTKTKFILTILDLNALYETSDPVIQKTFKRNLQKKINRASDIAFISKFTQSEVAKYFDLGDKNLHVIYCGIALTEISKKPKIIPDSKFIFSIGTVVPKKNFHVLIDFLKKLPIEYKIVLAGTTFHAYAADMLKRINDEGLNDRFFLVGTIDENEKRWYYDHACSLIFPSLFEGFGLPVAEAMSLGLPLFISDKTSLPEIGGEDAYYFRNFEADSMVKVFLEGLEDFNEEKKLRLIKRSKLFDWQQAAESYLKIYKQV